MKRFCPGTHRSKKVNYAQNERFINRSACRFSLLLAVVLAFSAIPAFAQSGLVISQIYGGGGNTGATFSYDFIELYNGTSDAIDLSAYSIQYASASGNSWGMVRLSGTIYPGRYFLLRGCTTSTDPTVDLPLSSDFDFPYYNDGFGNCTPYNLAAASGKVALVSNQTALSGMSAAATAPLSGSSCPLSNADAIVDFVGYGSATCYEGFRAAPAPSVTNSIIRTGDDHNTDTDNNNIDFVLQRLAGTPIIRNSQYGAGELSATGLATPDAISSVSSTTVLLTVEVYPVTLLPNPSTSIAVTADLSAIGGSAAQTFFDDGTNGDVNAGDNIFTFRITVASASPGTYSLPVTVTDLQGRTVLTSISLAVTPPTITPIDVIQGAKSTTGPAVSSYVGQTVTTAGVVTAVIGNGFFIQTPDGQDDGDPLTPEGIAVFTSSKPTVVIGDSVTVTGKIQTYPAVSYTPATEIVSPTITINSNGNTLPVPIVLTEAMLKPTDGLYQLTPYEGMRVQIDTLTAISATEGSLDELDETQNSTGYFYGVIGSTPRPFREPGIDIRDNFPSPPANVTYFDDNPERILVSSTLAGGVPIDLSTGAKLANVTGVLDFTYSSDTYYDPSRLILDAAWDRLQITPGMVPQPAPLPSTNEFTVASFNVGRFYNTDDSDNKYWIPEGVNGSSGQVAASSAVDITPAAYQRRLQKLSLAIRTMLNTPDIVVLEEVENQSVANDIASQINADAGIPDLYSAYSTDNSTYYTQDASGISVGFLVKNSTVDKLGLSQYGQNETFTTPSGSTITLNDRPWLVLNAGIKRAGASDYPVIVIANHMRSLSGVNSSSPTAYAREKKQAQAADIAKYINTLQTEGEHVISAGDINAYEFSDGYTDTLATYTNVNVLSADQVVMPGEAGLVTPPLVNMTLALPADQRWSYTYSGNAQSLDHMVVTPELAATGHIVFAHMNADQPAVVYNDATSPARVSDHDPIMGYFAIPAPGASVTLTVTPNPASYGDVVTLSAEVTAGATGEVEFLDTNGLLICAAPLVNGAASCQTVPGQLSAGVHDITADYGGDSTYESSTGGPESLTINPASVPPSVDNPTGAALIVKVLDVSMLQGTSAPTAFDYTCDLALGAQFYNGDTCATALAGMPRYTVNPAVDTTTPVGQNVATISVSGLTSQNYTVAFVSGNLSVASVSTTTELAVTNQSGAPVSAADYGQPVVLKAVVSASGGTTPEGMVAFSNGNTVLCVAPVQPDGTASCSLDGTENQILPAGSYSLTAAYEGDTTSAGSTSAAALLTVNKATVSPELTVTPNPPESGQPVTITSGPFPPDATGTVTITDQDGKHICTAEVSNGQASCQVVLPPGPTVSGEYSGDRNYNDSPVGPPVTVQSPTIEDFSITVDPSTQTVLPGVAASYTVTVAGTNGAYSCAVSMSAEGLPADATVVFDPATVMPGTTSEVSVTMTVTVPPQQSAAKLGTSGFNAKAPLALVALLIPLAAWRRRRSWGKLLTVFVLGLAGLVGSVAIIGCHPGGYFFQPKQPVQTYTFTVTGTSSCDSSKHSKSITLVVGE